MKKITASVGIKMLCLFFNCTLRLAKSGFFSLLNGSNNFQDSKINYFVWTFSCDPIAKFRKEVAAPPPYGRRSQDSKGKVPWQENITRVVWQKFNLSNHLSPVFFCTLSRSMFHLSLQSGRDAGTMKKKIYIYIYIYKYYEREKGTQLHFPFQGEM